MLKSFKFAIAAALFAVSSTSFAANDADAVDVVNPFARAVPPVAENSAAFMKLTNTTDSARQVVSAESDVAKNIELHTHLMDNGVMRMREIPFIQVDANSTTELKPGSFHVMLLGLNRPLSIDTEFELTLNFKDGSSETITVPVQKVKKMKKMSHGKCGGGKCGQGKCGAMK